MTRHPAGPFTVRVHEYSLEAGRVGLDVLQVYSSRHRSAKGAARRLATLVAGRSELSRQVRAAILPGKTGRYLVEAGDGTRMALEPFRTKFCS